MFRKQTNNKLSAAANHLRFHQTKHERAFARLFRQAWPQLTLKSQYVIGRYIVDFYVPARRLVIEIDGGQHCANPRDRRRDFILRLKRYKILRFWNNDVTHYPEGVFLKLSEYIGE